MKKMMALGLLFVSSLAFAVNNTLEPEDVVIATRTARFKVDDYHSTAKLYSKHIGLCLLPLNL